ncbi:PfkB family carbohydrate kinase [Brucella pseudogrignonensis]|uniref:PfkB family carbohydrate kinase n=1 Tax=Brucella pseudogrignonensis TaxID=419475 RepID=UPI000DE52D8A|nr:PfkB family carbohydrate kinase [Brucella pseudogrignonensis]KAB2690926.1 sugar kinase [Brucella pseudogrignonensis]
MTSKILCVGALTMDTILRLDELPHAAGKYLPREAVEIAAGMASSAAAAIARLGGNVALWASAGIDSVGDRAVAELSAEGIDCAYIRRLEGARTAFSSILVDANGERIIVPFYDRRLASPSDLVPPIAAGTYAAVMTDVRWPWAAETALRAARDAGIPAILDADTAPVELLETLLPFATHIVASEPAAISVTGTTDLRECVRILSNRYDVFTSVTAGADGCYWAEGAGKPVFHVAGFKVDAVDTLAAGDVFHGAFAHGLVAGKEMTSIIRFANAAAAIKCARFGGRAGSPSQDEVVSFIENGIVPAR